MIVIAHRGASGYVKENTLKSFKAAFDMGAKYLETDIQRTKDGKLVLYHDYILPGGKYIKESSLEDLKKIEVPELKDLFNLPGIADIKINLEIKNDANLYPGIEEEIFKVINSAPNINKNNLLISSFDFDTLKRVRSLDNSIKIGVLTRNFDIKQPLLVKAFSVNISASRITPQIIKTCKENNLKVLVYTVNDINSVLDLESLGADAIFSDYPDILSSK